MNDLDKKRLTKLNERHKKYSERNEAHQNQGIELARESDKLFLDYENFWIRVKGETKRGEG